MDLLTLAAFHRIVEHGGLGRASRAIPAPKTTLSRRLRHLEDDLGVRLVERGPRVFRLTEEGSALHLRTRALLAEIDEVGQALAGGLSRPRGRLRVSAPGLFADLHLGRIAAGFLARYPDVDLEIVSDDRLVDPLLEGIDVVIRVNPDAREDLVGRLLFREETLLVAAATFPRPSQAEDGAEAEPVAAVLLPTTDPNKTWIVEGEHGRLAVAPVATLRVSSILVARQAVSSGAGVALLPKSAVAADLDDGALASWGRLPDRQVELWVLHRSRRLRSPKVAAFVDFMCAAFSGSPGRPPPSIDGAPYRHRGGQP